MNFKSTVIGKLNGNLPIYFDGTVFYVKTKSGNMVLDDKEIEVGLRKPSLEELL